MKSISLASFALLLLAAPAFAQNAPAPGSPEAAAAAAAASAATAVSTAPAPDSKEDKKAPFRRSLFFSPVDLIDIDKASRGIVAGGGLGEATEKPIPQVRTITLTGLSYVSPNNWIVWLNGMKATPFQYPVEVQEIKVEPGRVHLKWFDVGANKVLVLPNMRPNEVYDIVTGVTLPDQTTVQQENVGGPR